MRIRLVYPSWQRIQHQTHYVLPPLGVATVAALTPAGHEVSIADENVAPVDASAPADLVGISVMLISQLPRAFAIADEYRGRGVPVVIGGLSASCLPAECGRHADAVVVGEAESVWDRVVADAQQRRLQPLYRREGFSRPEEFPVPRRDLLDPRHYTFRGLRMMDLIETSRGCRFGCLPCQVPYLCGRRIRPRAVADVVAEMRSLTCERVFVVDNSLEQDEDYQRRLLPAMAGMGKSWVSHPITARPDILKLAVRAGWWLVYQSVLGPSPRIREKVRRYHDHGIAVEATILFGLDEHGPDIFRRTVDFLREADVDIAEFTVLTPFPGTPLFDAMKRDGRLLHEDWARYNAESVVFRPARMSPEELQQGYLWAWEEFYREQSQAAHMFRLLRRLPSLRDWRPEAQAPDRVIPHQKAGPRAVWGRPASVSEAGRDTGK